MRSHVRNIYSKLDVHTRQELLILEALEGRHRGNHRLGYGAPRAGRVVWGHGYLSDEQPTNGSQELGFDVAVTAAAFLLVCSSVFASSIVIPDLALRQYFGMVNIVPDVRCS